MSDTSGDGSGGDYGSFTWESARVLAAHLHAIEDEVCQSVVVELGCGTAVPGLAAAQLGAPAVVLTDRRQSTQVLQHCQDQAEALGVSDTVQVVPLDWGETLDHIPCAHPSARPLLIIASDCFYDPRDYDDIFATVTDLLQRRGGRFITAYRIRTARSFQHSVIKWGLDMVQVPLPPALDDADVASSTRLLAFSLKHHHEQQQPPLPPPPLPPTAHKANAG